MEAESNETAASDLLRADHRKLTKSEQLNLTTAMLKIVALPSPESEPQA